MSLLKTPLSVPAAQKSRYRKNYDLATNGSGRMLLFAGDQKVEHLNDDFYGPKIAAADATPEHLFKIAAGVPGLLLAAHLGLISRYGSDYRQIPYLIKINGRTNIGPNEEKNSSKPWWSIEKIVKFQKESGLKIVGIGYTLYLGGKYEAKMLAKVAKTFQEAHQNGLITVLWVYPRGKNIKEEDIHTIAGGAGVAACLDADFVKVKYPYKNPSPKNNAEKFQEVVQAAGRTKVICVGGEKKAVKDSLTELNYQLKIAGTSGLAVGRNLHQRPLAEAQALARAYAAMIFKKAELSEALKIYQNKTLAPAKTSKFLGLF